MCAGPVRRLLPKLLVPLLAAAVAGCLDTGTPLLPAGGPSMHGDGEHSHGRFFHLTWAPVPGMPHTVEFTYKAAMRRSGGSSYPCRSLSGGAWVSVPCTGGGNPGIGDIFIDNVGGTGFVYGEGPSDARVLFRVTSLSVAENWLFAEAVDPVTGKPGIRRTYSGAGPYLAHSIDCCRISGLRNNGSNYGVKTLVTPGAANSSPVSNLVPIVTVARGGVRSWTIPASDVDGDPIRFSLTAPSAGPSPTIGGVQPAGMSVGAADGIVSWSTDGRALGLYWSNVTIEELDASGSPKGYVQIDYLINLIEGSGNNPPQFTSPSFCGGSVAATVDRTLAFTVSASDIDAGDMVAIAGTGIPSGASFTIAGPANPVSASFTWTPTTEQVGPRIVSFSATDQAGAQAVCNVTINVALPVNMPPVLDAVGDRSVDEGSTLTFAVSASDPEGDPLTFSLQGAPTGASIHPTTGVFSWTPADGPASATVTIVVSDGARTDSETITITVRNVAPTVDVGADAVVEAGQSFALTGSFSDPGVLDAPWTWSADWGDGTTSSGAVTTQSNPITATRRFDTPGTYTVALTVIDKDGDVGSDVLTLTVRLVSTGQAQGCTPGFWSQNGIRLGAWPTGFAPTHAVTSVFTASGYLGSATLLGALEGYRDSGTRRNTIDGAREILLRSAVAAVLNEAKFGGAYPASSVGAIVASVNGALVGADRVATLRLAELLDAWNNSYQVDENGAVVMIDGKPVVLGSCPL